jgi:hypothetical protein
MASKLARDAQTAIRDAGTRGIVLNSGGRTVAAAESGQVGDVHDALIEAGFGLELLTDEDNYVHGWIVTRNRKATR